MAKQPPVLNSECTEEDQIPPNRRTPHRPPRIENPTSIISPLPGHQSDEGGSSTASTPYSPNLYANRSPQYMLPRRTSHFSRTSSGYFSFEVSPAPVYCDKATQTPSLSCQAINHYLSEMAAARNANIAELRPEMWIAHELRRIGDEFDAIYNPRRGLLDNRHRGVDDDQVIILRVLRYIIRLIWRMQ